MAALDHLPLTRLPRVFHVGTLDPAHKGRASVHSLEGNGLSVSLHPEEWTRIAKLGGQPTWLMTRPGGGRFLSFHALSEHHRAELTAWGVDAGWLELKPQWRVGWYDSEVDGECHTFIDNEADARGEHEFRRDEGDDTANIAEVIRPLATARMVERVGFDPGALNALDIAATFYAEDVAGLDGVWWEDVLDPAGLSAPRGVINLTSLSSWERKLQAAPMRRMRP